MRIHDLKRSRRESLTNHVVRSEKNVSGNESWPGRAFAHTQAMLQTYLYLYTHWVYSHPSRVTSAPGHIE